MRELFGQFYTLALASLISRRTGRDRVEPQGLLPGEV